MCIILLVEVVVHVLYTSVVVSQTFMKIFDRQRDVCKWKYVISKVTVLLKDKTAKYKVCVATPTFVSQTFMKIFDRQMDVCKWEYFISKVTVLLKTKLPKNEIPSPPPHHKTSPE